MVIDVLAKSCEEAILKSRLSGQILFESKKPEGANSDVWIRRLNRMNKNDGMRSRLSGIHPVTAKRFGRLLIKDFQAAKEGFIIVEYTGKELKRFRREYGCKYTGLIRFKFLTLQDRL